MPETTKATARQVVSAVVAEVERRIGQRTRTAVSGALNRAARTHRPKARDIDWNRTIRANLPRYLPEHRTVVPERLVGFGRRQQIVARDIILAIDQSGSMASSVVYASVFGAVLASIRAVRTSVVVFDTAVVDLTEKLTDPVEVLFGTQLGGGTDINKAIAYSETLITRPRDSILVLISDLMEGGVREQMLARIARLVADGVVRRRFPGV
jgi:Mg-chelatase subunit ChlD